MASPSRVCEEGSAGQVPPLGEVRDAIVEELESALSRAQKQFVANFSHELTVLLSSKLGAVKENSQYVVPNSEFNGGKTAAPLLAEMEQMVDRRLSRFLASLSTRLDATPKTWQSRSFGAASSESPLRRRVARTRVPEEAQPVLDVEPEAELQEESSIRCRARARAIVNSGKFEFFWFFVTLINSVLLGCQVEMQSHGQNRDYEFNLANTVFCAFFLAELLLRVFASDGLFDFFCKSSGRSWHWFDTIIVALTTIDLFLSLMSSSFASNVRAFKLLRMMRVLRAVRILKIIHHIAPLWKLIQSIIGTFKSLVWAMVLLLVMIFVFSIMLTDAFTNAKESEDPPISEHFQDLNFTMITLFWAITGGTDCWPLTMALVHVHWVWCYLFIAFQCVCQFAVLNVMTAIFCQSAADSAGKDTELVMSAFKKSRQSLARDFEKLFDNLPGQKNGSIDLEHLIDDLQDAWVRDFFAALEIEASDASTLFQLLDSSGDGVIDGAEFVEGCMKLRGGAKAIDVTTTALEVKGLRHRVKA